uniref:uncharacterized protein LOC108588975 n=1 Tax=Callithrix jacchus TaxID=9483 RepID=UPI0023DD6647|nr:uncharacterized protein LOC108588975 [Callithrix jacchus]
MLGKSHSLDRSVLNYEMKLHKLEKGWSEGAEGGVAWLTWRSLRRTTARPGSLDYQLSSGEIETSSVCLYREGSTYHSQFLSFLYLHSILFRSLISRGEADPSPLTFETLIQDGISFPASTIGDTKDKAETSACEYWGSRPGRTLSPSPGAVAAALAEQTHRMRMSPGTRGKWSGTSSLPQCLPSPAELGLHLEHGGPAHPY